MEGPFADDRTSVLPTSNCRVCGTCREGRGGGAVGSVGVLRARCCHLRAGFQQCKSFVEMGTVRCCPLSGVEDCITSARRLWRAELVGRSGLDRWSGKRAAGGMSGDHDRCFSILVLGAFSTGVFNTNVSH